MSTAPTAKPVTLDRYELPGNLASLAALASSGQITIRPHELIRTTDGRVYHWTTSALEIVSAPVHHGTVADVAALEGIYLLPSCTRGVHPGDTAYVTAAGCEYRVTAGVNATATWAACASIEVGADPAGTAAAAVSAHNTATDSHADIRTLLDGKQPSLNISPVGTALLNLSTPAAAQIPRINADASVTLIDAPSNVEEVDANFVSITYNPGGGGSSAAFIGARVVLTASQSIANDTRQKVQWASVDYDTSGFFAAGTPARLSVPMGLGGKYLIGACVIWDMASGGSIRQFEIQRNNSTPYLVTEGKLPMGVNYFVGESACVQVELAEGDYLEVVPYQDSGFELNIIHHTTYGHINAFWLQRLG